MKLFAEEQHNDVGDVFFNQVQKEIFAIGQMKKSIVLLEKLSNTEVYDDSMYELTLGYIVENLGYPKDTELSLEGLLDKSKSLVKKVWRRVIAVFQRISTAMSVMMFKLDRKLKLGMPKSKLIPAYNALEKTIVNSDLGFKDQRHLLAIKNGVLDRIYETPVSRSWENLFNYTSPAMLFANVREEGRDPFVFNLSRGSAILTFNNIQVNTIHTGRNHVWSTPDLFTDMVPLMDTIIRILVSRRALLQELEDSEEVDGAMELISEINFDIRAIQNLAGEAGARAHILNQIIYSVTSSIVAPDILTIRPDHIGKY